MALRIFLPTVAPVSTFVSYPYSLDWNGTEYTDSPFEFSIENGFEQLFQKLTGSDTAFFNNSDDISCLFYT